MKTIGIILAGGKGERFDSTIPKQYIEINGQPIIQYVIDTFKDSELFDKIVIVGNYFSPNSISVYPGETRQLSCYNALLYIHDTYPDCENVIITEAVRLCITKETLIKCINKLNKYNALITVCKSVNTSCISKNKETLDNILDRTLQYDLLMPECFKFKKLYNAYKKINKDTTSIIEIFKLAYPNEEIGIVPISLWEGLKLTYPEDYKIFETLLKEK